MERIGEGGKIMRVKGRNRENGGRGEERARGERSRVKGEIMEGGERMDGRGEGDYIEGDMWIGK